MPHHRAEDEGGTCGGRLDEGGVVVERVGRRRAEKREEVVRRERRVEERGGVVRRERRGERRKLTEGVVRRDTPMATGAMGYCRTGSDDVSGGSGGRLSFLFYSMGYVARVAVP